MYTAVRLESARCGVGC